MRAKQTKSRVTGLTPAVMIRRLEQVMTMTMIAAEVGCSFTSVYKWRMGQNNPHGIFMANLETLYRNTKIASDEVRMQKMADAR